jgi:hypothetical protein
VLSDRVWDLTIHLVHPTLLYVALQMLIRDHMGDHASLRALGFFHWKALALDLCLFLGAWCVFYTTLLRDMAYPIAAGTVLLWTSLLGCAAQYLLFRDVEGMEARTVWGFLLLHALLAVALWVATMVRWRRLKQEHLRLYPGDPTK